MMADTNTEIRKIIEFFNTSLPISKQKNELEINNTVQEIIAGYEEKKYDFSSYESLTLKQKSKKRVVKQFKDWSLEKTLCILLKRCLDREFKIKYPNRNDQLQILFEKMASIQNMKDFTIIRFDFLDFFNTISSEYVYLKFIKNSSLERFKKELLQNFVDGCKYCYAGINTSNVMAEIISQHFDQLVKQNFYDKGLIFYRRYVDDGVLIFNRFLSEDEGKYCLNMALKSTFYDTCISVSNSCNTSLNMAPGKFTYITKRYLDNAIGSKLIFGFLGYQFILSSDNKHKTIIKYGITNDKIQKYTKKIVKIANDYKIDNNIELLRHRLKAFSCRTVYRRKNYSAKIWKSKGFISNYNELRYYLNMLDPSTEAFLKNGIKDALISAGVAIPYFLKGHTDKSPYSMYYNLNKNRTLLFEENERIGINMATLVKMCGQVGITSTGNKTYNALLREYLIKIKVGH
jgi:hypothetical protein